MSIYSHISNRALAHSVRFSSTPQHFPESVAEHSFFTAYIVSLLCNLLIKEGIEIDKAKALEMALIHDIEEVFSGDILGPFKNYSSEVKQAIRKVNVEILPQRFSDLTDELSDHYIALWTEEGTQESIEAQVVKAADRLSLITKCEEEVRIGNEFFVQILQNQQEVLENQEYEWWKRIRDQVVD